MQLNWFILLAKKERNMQRMFLFCAATSEGNFFLILREKNQM